MSFRVGADIGGTFTDLVIVSRDAPTFEFEKMLTTPTRPDDAVVEGMDRLLARLGTDRARIESVAHGTTLFVNALIERKGARTALVTTRGPNRGGASGP